MANFAYATTVRGIVKIVAVIGSLIAAICSGIYGAIGPFGFLVFVSACSLLIEGALFAIYIFQLHKKCQAPWLYIDFGISCVLGLLNIIAFGVAAAYGLIPAIGAAAFFFAVVLVALATDAFFLFRAGRGTGSQPRMGSPHPTDTVPPKNAAEQPEPFKMEL